MLDSFLATLEERDQSLGRMAPIAWSRAPICSEHGSSDVVYGPIGARG
jgi:hypothetical protein